MRENQKIYEQTDAKAAGMAQTHSDKAFPCEHWQSLRINNMLRRILREIRGELRPHRDKLKRACGEPATESLQPVSGASAGCSTLRALHTSLRFACRFLR